MLYVLRGLLSFSWHLPLALARIVNRTINDRFGDWDTLQQVTNPRRRSFGRTRPAAHSFYWTIQRPSRQHTLLHLPLVYIVQFTGKSLGCLPLRLINLSFFACRDCHSGGSTISVTLTNFTLDENNAELSQHASDPTEQAINWSIQNQTLLLRNVPSYF